MLCEIREINFKNIYTLFTDIKEYLWFVMSTQSKILSYGGALVPMPLAVCTSGKAPLVEVIEQHMLASRLCTLQEQAFDLYQDNAASITV